MKDDIIQIKENQQLIITQLAKITQQQDDELLTCPETLDFLKISRNTFDRLREQGRIKVYKIGAKILCKKGELLQFINESQQYTRA